ncbi:alcohol dehydrogenase catalytic domain-containing protein [Microbacterium sulfonylureivorans]|uniref:alcohol dehydrogenase catalytic domain-containing protein n=1 Tax=Microbacterium sulfonylureivorans TaxID=2486854 RepID=UPI000FD717F8|nr:alcohol dehydrogenase catalytic domain-containing protein [Microbacterium sulfonylureivorans]
MTTLARGLVVREPGDVTLEEITIADPAAGEVLIRVEATGICHTDVAWAAGALYSEFPVTLGHETSGTVVSVGSAVTRIAEGDRVVVALTHHCGHCLHCESGHPMLCAARTVAHPRLTWGGAALAQGFGVSGFASHVLVGESSCVPVPDSVPLEVAALVGCAIATGVGAVLNVAQVTPGARVLVIGAGGIGLSVVMGATVSGAEQIVVIEPSDVRRAHARRLGATDTLAAPCDELADLAGDGFDYVFESAGLVSTMEQAIALARRGGTVTLLGAPPPDQEFRVPALDFVASQKRLLGCITGDVSPVVDFDRYFRLYSRGLLPLDALITSSITLDRAAEMLIAGAPPGEIRVVVRP